jgi:hypothetical protein
MPVCVPLYGPRPGVSFAPQVLRSAFGDHEDSALSEKISFLRRDWNCMRPELSPKAIKSKNNSLTTKAKTLEQAGRATEDGAPNGGK